MTDISLSRGHENDLISRQGAIDAICREGTRLERNGTVAMVEIKQWCVDLIEELPSAQPEQLKNGGDIWDKLSEVYNMDSVPDEAKSIIGDVMIAVTEQPEIIRCKDCKYWGKRGLCEKWDHYISNEDFYCGCAERRTDGSDRQTGGD